MSDKVSRPLQTPAQRREARESKRFVADSLPPSSPTRIAPAAARAKAQPDAKQMQAEIIAQYKEKYGHPPELEAVMAEVWKRLGFSRLPAWQKKQFAEK